MRATRSSLFNVVENGSLFSHYLADMAGKVVEDGKLGLANAIIGKTWAARTESWPGAGLQKFVVRKHRIVGDAPDPGQTRYLHVARATSGTAVTTRSLLHPR